MKKDSSILLVGPDDIIEKSLSRLFATKGFRQVHSTARMGMNPTIQSVVLDYFQDHRPEYVIISSVRSGGIQANQDFPAEFMYENLAAQNNILYAAKKFGIHKILYLASSCVYPKDCPQPMGPEHLLTGPLEPTSEPYALSKIAGIKLCQSFRKQYGMECVTMIPATLYGPDQDMDPDKAHVMGAIMGKVQKAKDEHAAELVLWGSGNPRREFIYQDDFASAALFVLEHGHGEEIWHAGTGEDVSIADLAKEIKFVVGYEGTIRFDSTKPDGAPRKLLKPTPALNQGWSAKVNLREGLKKTYETLYQPAS